MLFFYLNPNGLELLLILLTLITFFKKVIIKNLNKPLLFTFLAVSICNFSSAQNPIVAENALPGNPKSEWDGITGAGDMSIQGFATDISVNKGSTIQFKINTDATAYTITIYRLGYYNGLGARKITTFNPSVSLPQVQPAELNDNITGMTDCGSWNVSAQWAVPSTVVSGVYIARLKRTDNGGASHIVFVVRDDASTSDILFQTSDATWQAYNLYGGHSFYVGVSPTSPVTYPNNRASKISYNRPIITRGGGGGGGEAQDWIFNAEYPMIRWLERNGYNVSYFTNVDAKRHGNLILNHKAFVSVGHDEYWSGEAFNNVMTARNAGVSLAFFAGNSVYWKTRYEPSIDGTNTADRTLVCYKEGTLGEFPCGSKCDPLPNVWTGLWRDGASYPAADGNRPENSLTGQIGWKENQVSMEVPDTYKNYRFWRNTSITTLGAGQVATLANGTLGYEWEYDQPQYASQNPAGRMKLSSTVVDGFTHNLTLYKHSSGALVFGAGTVQWSWGLDAVHDREVSVPDIRIQQATVNLFADMACQPATLQSGITVATASTDNIAPATNITFPATGANAYVLTPITITGTTTDANVVAGVEISLDGGNTWQMANGDNNWSYTWTPTTEGTYTIKTRGFDDSGNLQAATGVTSTFITLTVKPIDNTIPTTVITSPPTGTNTNVGTPITITGTASDNNIVASVEISFNDGTTWTAVTGTNSWSYTWTPGTPGNYKVRTRAIDDAGNIQPSIGASSTSITVIVNLTDPNAGRGGPILVISSTTNPYSRYAVEILRAEGLNEFKAMDITAVTAAQLSKYDVVILGEMALTTAQATMFTTWTDAGGVFISFRPDVKLASLLGITKTASTLLDKYLLINASGPGTGIVNQSMQFHGAADLYTLNGATALAHLYTNATTASANPAIAVNNRPNSGKAIAFTYDLAKSIIYTRQGNPAWAGQKRDGAINPIRPDDMFYPDWVDFNKIAIPQADEQQRMLANIITKYNLDKKPLPRLWYLPKGLKAAVVMTGDDHKSDAQSKTIEYFNLFKSKSTSNTATAVADWDAVRGTSYIYSTVPLTNTQAKTFEAQGFEMALHLNTNCDVWTPTDLTNFFNTQLPQMATKFPGIAPTSTHRIHCFSWSDWASLPKIEVQKGIRLNTSYYYWPAAWVQNRPGMFTGSGFPMRFADVDGTLIDNYQLVTQISDESNLTIPAFCNQLFDKAIGAEGYYGTFCANWHTDNADTTGAIAIINAAKSRNIPIISSRQLLTWLDGRNNTSMDSIKWVGNVLSFTITGGARNLEAMVPIKGNGAGTIALNAITSTGGTAVTFRTEVIKGINYAFFRVSPGAYNASYTSELPCTAPTGNLTSQNGQVCSVGNAAVIFNATNGAGPFKLVLNGTTYNNIVSGSTINTNIKAGEQSIWPNTATPTIPVVTNAQPIEVGVKFKTAINGSIKAIRFYKGSATIGENYVVKLYKNSTQVLLASVNFTNASAAGWQVVNFSTPIAVSADTTYVAAYYSASGKSSSTPNYFDTATTRDQLTALANDADGPNSIYKLGTGGGFPTLSAGGANYWADVVFTAASPIVINLTSITDANSCNNAGNLSSTSLTINSGCSSLPVALINFKATKQGANALLQWSTASEQNNKGFEIQRSTDGIKWVAIDFVKGAGNSQLVTDYQYIDKNMTTGKYYYRLKQVDFDGTEDFSKIAIVAFTDKGALELKQNHPNPFSNNTTIDIIIPETGKIKLTLYNQLGTAIKVLINEVKNAGTYQIIINRNGLASGVYYYKLDAKEQTVIKKMTVL